MKVYVLGAQQGTLCQTRIFIPNKGVAIYEVQDIRYKYGQIKFIGFSDVPKTLEEAMTASSHQIEIIKEEDVPKNIVFGLIRAWREAQRIQDELKKISEKFFNEVV